MDDEYDMIFKVVLVGDSGVGKSNILTRYLDNTFTEESKATVGVEFGAKKLEINNSKIKAQIWDTAGQERYRSITNAYYKGAKGALLVYDVTATSSFSSIDRWISELKSLGDPDMCILIVGNKIDLGDKRLISADEVKRKAEDLSNYNLLIRNRFY